MSRPVKVVAVCLLALAVGSHAARGAADISAIELAALRARRAIERGHVELEKTYRRIAPSGEERKWLDRRTIFFDSGSIRNDIFKEYEPALAKDRGKSYRVVSSFTEKEHISYSDEVLPNGRTIGLTIRPRESVNPVLASSIDPRLMGMVPASTGNYVHYTLESVVGRPDRRETSVEEVVLRGNKCSLVRYTRNDGLIARIWICPEKSFSVIRLEVETGTGESHYLNTVECTMARYEASDVWFPESITFSRLRGGKLIREERAKVKVISLSKALPDDTFTLAGIGVPPGKRVYFVPDVDRRHKIWDGKSIVPVHRELQGESIRTAWSVRRTLFSAISLIALIVMIAVLAYRHRTAEYSGQRG